VSAHVVDRARTSAFGPVLGLALAALALRGVGTLSLLVPAAGAAGVLFVQTRDDARVDRHAWVVVTLAGMLAFAAVRVAMPAIAPQTTLLGIVSSVVAAVAEEIVFRRGLYGALERVGPVIAIVATSLAFGVVHAPMYGWRVVPIDIAAGLVLGWQRWASGSWTSPALTHVFANLLGAF